MDETQGFDVRSRYVEDEDVVYWILMSKLVSLSVSAALNHRLFVHREVPRLFLHRDELEASRALFDWFDGMES